MLTSARTCIRTSLIPIGGNQNVYQSHYRNDAGRQLQSDGAGVIGLVRRFALPIIIAGAHIALFLAGVLTGPAPELVIR